ncbi:hypothetical protein LTS18_012149, partial [Coniosporium uncinatum]
MNGTTYARDGRSSGGYGDNGGRPGGSASSGPFKHISLLQAQAEDRINRMDTQYMTIKNLVQTAQDSAKSANNLAEWRRPDAAYVEFIIASELVLNRIPRHKDAPSLNGDRGSLYQSYRTLFKHIKSEQDRFRNIKEIIINDNQRSGVTPGQPSFSSQSSGQRSSNTLDSGSSNDELHFDHPRSYTPNGLSSPRSNRTSTVLTPTSSRHDDVSGRSTPDGVASSSPRRGPPIRPKPESMHGRAMAANGAQTNGSPTSDALRDRFAQLRTGGQLDMGVNKKRDSGSSVGTFWIEDSPVRMPSPTEHGSSVSALNGTSTSSVQPAGQRPAGPRDMPGSNMAPPPPPKLPPNTVVGGMPQAPSPAYSPARNMQTPSSINPPRSSARSIVGTGGRQNSIAASSASSHAPGNDANANSYFPAGNGVPPQVRRRTSLKAPLEHQITAQQLYDYLK